MRIKPYTILFILVILYIFYRINKWIIKIKNTRADPSYINIIIIDLLFILLGYFIAIILNPRGTKTVNERIFKFINWLFKYPIMFVLFIHNLLKKEYKI